MLSEPLPIPAPGFHKNPGSFPNMIPKETQLRIQFANGRIDLNHTYTPAQIRCWAITGFAFDVGAIAVAE